MHFEVAMLDLLMHDPEREYESVRLRAVQQ